jgi:rhodanese-related sulfurtransferase
MTKSVKQMIGEASAAIEMLSVEQALALQGNPDVQFVDVRDQTELAAQGTIAGAVHAPRALLEFIADPESPMHRPELASGKRLVLFCAAGGRSTLAAKTLKDMGIERTASLAGGFTAWKASGGPSIAV